MFINFAYLYFRNVWQYPRDLRDHLRQIWYILYQIRYWMICILPFLINSLVQISVSHIQCFVGKTIKHQLNIADIELFISPELEAHNLFFTNVLPSICYDSFFCNQYCNYRIDTNINGYLWKHFIGEFLEI